MSSDDPSALIDEQIARTQRAITPRVGVFFAIWGVVWLVSAVVALVMPATWPTWITIGVLWLAGGVSSGVYGAHFGAGVHGGSRRTGQRFAITFVIGIAWAVAVAFAVALRLPADMRLPVGLAIVVGVVGILALAVSRIGVAPIGLMLASLVMLVAPTPMAVPIGAGLAGMALLVEALRRWRADR